MHRIAIGVVVGVAAWLGSALAAEAQSITPIGPTSVRVGDTTTTYQATVTLNPPCNHYIKLWVKHNGVQKHSSNNLVPNPGTSPYTWSKIVNISTWGIVAGDTLLFKAQLLVGGQTYNATDWTVTVSATRPSSLVAGPGTRHGLTVACVERDRRLEK